MTTNEKEVGEQCIGTGETSIPGNTCVDCEIDS